MLALLTTGTLSTLASVAQAAPMKAQILAETGCPSGLVLLNVETACIASDSPALQKLAAGKHYNLDTEAKLNAAGTSYDAYVSRAEETEEE